MSDDELFANVAGMTRDDLLWEGTREVLALLSADVEAAVYRAAVVHWFDPRILSALEPAGAPDTVGSGRSLPSASSSVDVYAELTKLYFVEPYPDRGHNLHSLTRAIVLDHLWSEDREFFRAVSAVAADYYEDEVSDVGAVEFVYHQLAADEEDGIDSLVELYDNLSEVGRVGILNGLVQAAEEHAEAGRLTVQNSASIQMLKANLMDQVGDLAEASRIIDRVLEVPDDGVPPWLKAQAELTSGFIHYRASDLEQASSAFESALRRLRSLEHRDHEEEAEALLGLGDVAREQGNYRAALDFYGEGLSAVVTSLDTAGSGEATAPPLDALDPGAWRLVDDSFLVRVAGTAGRADHGGDAESADAYRELDADLAIASACERLASLHSYLAHHADAVAWANLAGRMYGLLDDGIGVARVASILVGVAADTGDRRIHATAIELQHQVLAWAENRGHSQAELTARLNLANAFLQGSDYASSREHFEAALALARSPIGRQPDREAEALEGLASLDWIAGRIADAADGLGQALDIHRTRDRSQQARILKRLGDLELDRHDRSRSAESYGAALGLYEKMGIPDGQIEALTGLGSVAEDDEDFEAAAEHFSRAVELARRVGLPLSEAESLLRLGQTHRLAGKKTEARREFNELLQIVDSLDMPNLKARLFLSLGDLALDEEDVARASEFFVEAQRLAARTENIDRELDASVGLILVQRRRGEYKRAIDMAVDLLSRARKLGDRSMEIRAMRQIASSHEDLEQYTSSAHVYGELSKLEPGNAEWLGLVGWELYQSNEFDRSLESSLKAFDMDSSETWVLTNVGLALLALGRLDDAERYFRRRIELRRPDEDFTEDAIKDLQDFLKRNPGNAAAQDFLALFIDAQAGRPGAGGRT